MTFSQRLLRYFFYALSLTVLVACSSGSDNAPNVTLSASPSTITPGQSSQLSWTVTGAEPITLSISPDLGIDELISPVTITPSETTTYTLTATNDDGSRSDSVTITVLTDGAGAITDFAATTDGLTAAFTWSLAVTESVGCTLDVGDGSEVRTFENCLDTQDATHTYANEGTYTATLTLASGDSATVVVNVGLGSVEVTGFVDEQSRNVVIILTDEDVEQAGTDLNYLNSAIATVEASLGVTTDAPAIRGMNAAVLGLLQTQQARPSDSTVPLFNFASEFVVAVNSDGDVLATSPLTRLGEEDDEEDSTRKQARLQFDIDIPVEQDTALLIAEPDGRGGWVCKSQLEYQTLDGQRTVSSEQTLYRFPQSLSGTTDLNAGAFQFNELTANPASRTEATSNNIMADELPSDEVLAATVSLEDAPDFQDGVYQFCNNPDIARNTVSANLDWRSDIFDVVTLPTGASEDLAQGEAAVYDYGIALLLDTDTTEDEDGNLVANNRLVGSAPIDAQGNLNINLVRSAFDNLDATLFFTDAAFFDAEKRRFPLTPSYQFDATAQANGTRSTRQGVPEADNIDLGTLEGGLAYISGQVVTDQGDEVADANVIMVLDSTRLAFNVATADDTGFYELLIPSGLVDKYILYAQNPQANLAGIASNDDTGSRYEVPEPAIINQDIILNVPLEPIDDDIPRGGTPIVSGGGNRQIRLGDTLNLEGNVSFVDQNQQRSATANGIANQDIADLILRWQILEAPEGSTAQLTSTDTLATDFTPDLEGRYRLRFSVFDGETLTADVINVDVFGEPDNTVLFLAEGFDPIFDEPVQLAEGEITRLTLERFGTTINPLTVQVQVELEDQSTLEGDILINGRDIAGTTFPVTFPAGRSRTAFNLSVPQGSLENASERLVLSIVDTFEYIRTEPDMLTFEVTRGLPSIDRFGVVSLSANINDTITSAVLSVSISNAEGFVVRAGETVIAGSGLAEQGFAITDLRVTIDSPDPTISYNVVAFNGGQRVIEELFITIDSVSGAAQEERDFELNGCDTWSVASSGGAGTTTDIWDITDENIPRDAVFDIRYDTFFIPDRIAVFYPGDTPVLDTGWRGASSYEGNPLYPGGISGPGVGESLGFFTRGAENTFRVVVQGPQPGTAWNYQVRCRVP